MSIPDLCLASPNATPFIITVQDAILLESSEGFSILRQHLAETCIHGFCEEHSVESAEDQQAWISMRDILHALLAPIVALQDHATSVAQRFTGATTPEGLEFAFQGVGRNAFVWLQSFLSTDADWCLSNDCPACITQLALDAEFQIRLILASCLLSESKSATEMGRPTLPSFHFFLRSVRDAMDEDDLWRDDYYDHMEHKAFDLKRGMDVLMKQCQRLEMSMTPPVTPEFEGLPIFDYFTSHSQAVGAGMPIKRSKLAKNQMKMMKEEEKWLRVAQDCWKSLTPGNFSPSVTTEFVRRMSVVGGP